MIVLVLLLSIPLRSGGAGIAASDGFSISLNNGGTTLRTGKAQRPAATETVLTAETSGQAPGDIGTLAEHPPLHIDKMPPSDREGAEPEPEETAGQNNPLLSALQDDTARNSSAGGKDSGPQTVAGEKPVQDALPKKVEAVDRDDKLGLSPPAVPSPSKSAGPDSEAGSAKRSSEKQSLAMTDSVAASSGDNKASYATGDQENVQKKTELREASLEAKNGISVMEETPAPSLRKKEALQKKKEDTVDKAVKPSPETSRNAIVQAGKSPVSPLSTQNRQAETVPAALTAGDMISSPAERNTTVIVPSHEVPKAPVPAPVNAAAVPNIPDAHDQDSAGKKTVPAEPQRAALIDLTPSHEPLSISDSKPHSAGAGPSLQVPPDIRGSANVISPETEKRQDKTLPLSAAPEAETKTIPILHPEIPARIEGPAKPLTSSVPPDQNPGADTISDKEQKAVRVPDAAYASPALPKESRPLHKAPEGRPAKSSGLIAESSPKQQEKTLHTKGNEKNAAGDSAAKAALEKAAPSAITTSEIPARTSSPDLQLPLPSMRQEKPKTADVAAAPAVPKATQGQAVPPSAGTSEKPAGLPSSDKQSLPTSVPPQGISKAADTAARPAAPSTEMAQNSKDLQNPAAPIERDEKQNGTQERQGIPLPEVLLSKDIQVEIFLKGSGIPPVFTRFTKRPYPVPSRREPAKKEEEVHYTARTKEREPGEAGMRLLLSVASADKGVYSFAIENKGKEGYEAAVLFHLYEGRGKARTKEYRDISLRAGAVYTFKFVLPDAIFWDDDVFSVVMEDSKYITKVLDTSGLVWKEEKEPIVADAPATSASRPVPALLKSH